MTLYAKDPETGEVVFEYPSGHYWIRPEHYIEQSLHSYMDDEFENFDVEAIADEALKVVNGDHLVEKDQYNELIDVDWQENFNQLLQKHVIR